MSEDRTKDRWALVAAAVLVGLTASLVGFVQARRERARAEQEAAKALAINEFLITDLLAEGPPKKNR